MTLSQAASLFNVSAVMVVLVISTWVGRRYPQPFFGQWVASTAVGVLLMTVEAAAGIFGRPFPVAVVEVALMATTAWLHLQCGNHLRGAPAGWRVYGLLVGGLTAVGAALLWAGLPFPLAPALFAFSGALVYVGVVIANRAIPGKRRGMWHLGAAVALLGLWPLTYPVMQAQGLDWVGFWISGLLHMLVGSSMIVYLLDNVTASLKVQNDRLRELDELKGNFLSTVSHELRTPLTSIVGYLELMEDGIGGPLAPTQHEYVSNMRQSATHLSGLVDTILDSMRLQRGALAVRREAVDVAAAMRLATETLRAVAERKGVALACDVAPALPHALADEVRLTQVLHNLMGNALKFTPPGGRVQVSALRDPARPARLLVRVTDTGIGIPPEAVPRVFEPFFQVDDSLTREHGGTGLGLAIVRDMVGAMGGEVGVESAPGRGSEFWFTLPEAAPTGPAGTPGTPAPATV